MEQLTVGRDGTKIYLRSRPGPSAVTAILCDGICCDGFVYKYLWDDLNRLLSVAHWNYRGHGRSAAPVDPDFIDVAAHASDLDAVRRAVGDPPVVLIGHSFGTQVALEAYRLRREKIVGMVFLCGSFGRVTHTFKGSDVLAQILPRLREMSSEHPKIARALWSRVPPKIAVRIGMLTGDLDARTVRPEDVEPYFKHVAHIDFPMFVRMLEHAGEHSAEDLLPDIDVPVLVIAGDRDSFTPPELSAKMAEILAKGELVMLAGGTHVAPLEQNELVILRIEKFLAEHQIP